MKKVLALGIIAMFLAWGVASEQSQSKKQQYSLNNEVTLYATAWCGYCAKARKLLNDNHIKFTEFDVEKSREGHKQFKALGGTGVPVLVVNGKVVDGYNASKILSLLNKK